MDFNTELNNLKAKLLALSGKGGANSAAQPGKTKKPLPNVLKPAIHLVGKYCVSHENMLGVEISPHYIRLCQMKNSYGRWSLAQLDSACMENQFTNMDIRMNIDLYADNLSLLLEKHHIKTKDAALSIPTSVSIIKVINMPDMEEEDLAGAAAMGGIWESMVQLQGGIHEYSVYYQVLQRKVRPSESLAVAITAPSQASALDNLFADSSAQQAVASEGTPIASLNNLLAENPATPEPTPSLNNLLADSNTTPAPSPSLDNLLAASDTDPATPEAQPQDTPVLPIVEAAPEPAAVEAEVEIASQAEIIAPAEEANTMDVLFVAAKITDIQLYIDIAQKAGLKPVVVDVKCNSIKHAFDTNPERKKIAEPYALLEFGADENYVYIIDGMATTTFNLPISEDDRQLMAKNENNEEILRGFTQRYAEQLIQILESYSKHSKEHRKVYNIYVSSTSPLHVEDASAHPMINTFISQMSELMGAYKITSCTFCNHLEVPAEFAKKVNAEGNLSAWATVVGLATYKLDIFGYNKKSAAIDKVNLLPDCSSIRKNRATQILSTMAMAAVLAVVMFLSLSSYTITFSHGLSLASEIKSLEPAKEEFDVKTKDLQKLSIVMNKVKSLDSVRDTLPSNQVKVLDIYKNINNSIPEGVWLVDVSFKAPKSVDIKGNSINDQNILEFVKKLNESGGFKKASLKTMEVFEKKTNDKASTTQSGDASSLKKFSIQGELLTSPAEDKLELLSSGVK